ncbi:WXG100 family type VII secretion target [Corynebacterium aquatimens]|uniref:ESAT-6-like protein n=1 Tax=Corynebacterium aquatimens TaxID=1190508 RepID=A0A931E605_9CORY|nr:WXG100 family type VII secretion target [Corynebacterium aquatimens]MBG6123048.1 WXG100 family type VII secretion target [Corynebacterium aquatimens]WJY66618.1 6 kDa early secretory antigenic target [Corynebacterium aquatimens]
MSVIKYGFGSLATAATDIETSSLAIGAQLEDLKGQIKPMVSAWEGDAADSYLAHQAKWDQAAAELNEILTAISRAVADGNDRMRAVNTAAANSWG